MAVHLRRYACPPGNGTPDSEEPTVTPAWSQGAIPTVAELTSVLLTGEAHPAGGRTPQRLSGIFVFCPQASAESIQAAETLTWQADVQLDQIPDGATVTPNQSPPTPLITVDQWLLADDPTQVEGTSR